MPLAHAAAACAGRSRHAAAAFLPSVLCCLPRHTRPFLSAAFPSRKEATAAAVVLPEPLPASHWKEKLSRYRTSILLPTEAATQELVDAIGQEHINGATVVNLNAGPGNFARFLYHNTDARTVCVNSLDSFDSELQKLQDASGGRISSAVASPFEYLEGVGSPLNSVLGHLAERPWSADPPPLLVLYFNMASTIAKTFFYCIKLMTERPGIWSYGRVPLYLTVPDIKELHSINGNYDEAGIHFRNVLPIRLLSHIADVSVTPIRAAFHKIGNRKAHNMSLLSIKPKPITVVPPGASAALLYVVTSFNLAPRKPLRVVIKTLAAGADDILSDFSASPDVKVIDLTMAQLVELTRLYDCWPFRPPLVNMLGD